MQLTVKALKGKETNIQVSENDTILTVKRLVEDRLQVPVSQQRLLFRGKALSGKLKCQPIEMAEDATPIGRLCKDVCAGKGACIAGAKYSGDEHSLSFYSIGPDSRLNLMVKERASPEMGGNTVWKSLAVILGRHFSPSDTERILEYVQKDYERSLSLLSLDDIERLATRILHPQLPETIDLGFLD